MTLHVAILGSGNIGTDLMYKVIRNPALELAGVAGADPASEGLARARALGIATTDRGVGPFLAEHPEVASNATATSGGSARQGPTPRSVVALPSARARARPSDVGSAPATPASSSAGFLITLYIRSVPMLPDPRIATWSVISDHQ